MNFTEQEIKEGEDRIKEFLPYSWVSFVEGFEEVSQRKSAIICAIIAQKMKVSVRYEYFSNPEYNDDGVKLNHAKRILQYLESL